jgi:ABC-type multidrug transport system ATPase subunit
MSARADAVSARHSARRSDLGRALIKQPDLLVLNRPVNALDAPPASGDCRKCDEVHRCAGQDVTAVVWVLSNPAFSSYFDTICVFDGGQLVEQGREMILKRATEHSPSFWQAEGCL